MENALIPLTTASIGGDTQQGVNARELHQFLEIGKDFSTWIKDRVSQYDFIENQDFVKFSPNLGKTSEGGRPTVEYFLTLSMAKELSMVERNEKGKEARLYFIRCEQIAKDATQRALPQSYAEALRELAANVEEKEALQAKNIELEKKVEEDAPRVEMAKRCIESDGAWLIRNVAKLLKLTQTFVFDYMRQKKILSMKNEPYAAYVQNGVIRPRFSSYTDRDGNEHTTITPYVTAKGIEYLIKCFLKEGILKSRPAIQLELLQGD